MNIFNITNSQYAEIQTWSHFNNKIIKFKNNSNSVVFNKIFGDQGDILISYYVLDCDRDFIKFLTYLTTEQHNNLFIYIVNITL